MVSVGRITARAPCPAFAPNTDHGPHRSSALTHVKRALKARIGSELPVFACAQVCNVALAEKLSYVRQVSSTAHERKFRLCLEYARPLYGCLDENQCAGRILFSLVSVYWDSALVRILICVLLFFTFRNLEIVHTLAPRNLWL